MIRIFCDSCKSELSGKTKYYKGVALSAAPSSSGMTFMGWASEKITCEPCYALVKNVFVLWERGLLIPCSFCGDKGSYWEQGPNSYATCTQCTDKGRALRAALNAINR